MAVPETRSALGPTSITDEYVVTARAPPEITSTQTVRYGKWLVFKDVEQLDDTWRVIKQAVESGELGAMEASCSTRRYNPTEAGPGSKQSGVIRVFTSEETMDEVGFRLVQLVKHDISYKTEEATRKGIYVHSGAKKTTIKTVYWNNGEPSLKLTGKPFSWRTASLPEGGGASSRGLTREFWSQNIARAPVDRESSSKKINGKWLLYVDHEKMSEVWHIVKDEIESGKLGALEAECPPSSSEGGRRHKHHSHRRGRGAHGPRGRGWEQGRTRGTRGEERDKDQMEETKKMEQNAEDKARGEGQAEESNGEGRQEQTSKGGDVPDNFKQVTQGKIQSKTDMAEHEQRHPGDFLTEKSSMEGETNSKGEGEQEPSEARAEKSKGEGEQELGSEGEADNKGEGEQELGSAGEAQAEESKDEGILEQITGSPAKDEKDNQQQGQADKIKEDLGRQEQVSPDKGQVVEQLQGSLYKAEKSERESEQEPGSLVEQVLGSPSEALAGTHRQGIQGEGLTEKSKREIEQHHETLGQDEQGHGCPGAGLPVESREVAVHDHRDRAQKDDSQTRVVEEGRTPSEDEMAHGQGESVQDERGRQGDLPSQGAEKDQNREVHRREDTHHYEPEDTEVCKERGQHHEEDVHGETHENDQGQPERSQGDKRSQGRSHQREQGWRERPHEGPGQWKRPQGGRPRQGWWERERGEGRKEPPHQRRWQGERERQGHWGRSRQDDWQTARGGRGRGNYSNTGARRGHQGQGYRHGDGSGGGGNRARATIMVYTSEANIEEVGRRLIQLVEGDIRYETREMATPEGRVLHSGRRVLHWNNGEPAFESAQHDHDHPGITGDWRAGQ